ncbi:MAG: hypothetical protein ACJ8AT_05845 [Hyalangium sp.]|uniref:hypothetical protein n=1 Tax=Hyalangium sp. TaxID=2028555 RepID=UPI00389A0842
MDLDVLRKITVLPNPPPSIPPAMTLEQAQEAILQCLMQGPAGHYRIGKLYNHIVRNRLAVSQGYATTRRYFRRHVRVLSQSTLTMYGAVARQFSLEECEKYGMANLGALLEYARLSCTHVSWRDPGSTPVWIPRKGGLEISKPFADCTAEDLRDAIKARRAWPGQGRLEPEEKPVEAYLETLQQHFEENTQFPPKIDARVHNRRLHVRIRHLRLWELGRLLEALRSILKPAPPAPPQVPPLAGQAAARVSTG